jgi:hypothetical protein
LMIVEEEEGRGEVEDGERAAGGGALPPPTVAFFFRAGGLAGAETEGSSSRRRFRSFINFLRTAFALMDATAAAAELDAAAKLVLLPALPVGRTETTATATATAPAPAPVDEGGGIVAGEVWVGLGEALLCTACASLFCLLFFLFFFVGTADPSPTPGATSTEAA